MQARIGAAAAALLVLAGCGGGAKQPAAREPAAPPVPPLSQITLIPSLTVRGGGSSIVATRFPEPWVVSFDVRIAPGARLAVSAGARRFVLDGTGRPPPPGWLSSHVELTADRLAIDGRRYPVSSGPGSGLSFSASGGTAHITALIVSGQADAGALLLHRLAELHARLPADAFPIGASTSDQLHNSSTYWTSGFWPGALWQAAALAPQGGIFARWALAATVHHFGQERADTHDVGFMYGQSSLSAYRALCTSGRAEPDDSRPAHKSEAGSRAGRRREALCSRLKRSAIAAADELVALAASNSRAGTIPTNTYGSEADTIVDSMMNIAILPWATQVTGNPAYERLAERHAHRVAALLVRPDGSTIQAVNFDRASGKVVSFATHQGISERSTWARGEGWALYGFAVAASELHDRGLLSVAQRIARWVSAHLPAGVPRWDYDAPAGAPVDVSAGVITAAGLLHLAAACRQLERSCPAARGWSELSHRMLGAALHYASAQPPLGLLRGQVLNERAHGWANGGELSFGLSYALEALRLGP